MNAPQLRRAGGQAGARQERRVSGAPEPSSVSGDARGGAAGRRRPRGRAAAGRGGTPSRRHGAAAAGTARAEALARGRAVLELETQPHLVVLAAVGRVAATASGRSIQWTSTGSSWRAAAPPAARAGACRRRRASRAARRARGEARRRPRVGVLAAPVDVAVRRLDAVERRARRGRRRGSRGGPEDVEDAPRRDVHPRRSAVDLVAELVEGLLQPEEVEQLADLGSCSTGRYGLPAATSRYESRNCARDPPVPEIKPVVVALPHLGLDRLPNSRLMRRAAACPA